MDNGGGSSDGLKGMVEQVIEDVGEVVKDVISSGVESVVGGVQSNSSPAAQVRQNDSGRSFSAQHEEIEQRMQMLRLQLHKAKQAEEEKLLEEQKKVKLEEDQKDIMAGEEKKVEVKRKVAKWDWRKDLLSGMIGSGERTGKTN